MVLFLTTAQTYASPIQTINSIRNRKVENSIGLNLINDSIGKKNTKIKMIDNKLDLIKNKSNKNYDDYVLGVDVSKWNGTINWKDLKEANIKFVIIRAGYGGNNIDPRFNENIENAIKNNMLIGVYWFSYALNNKEAIQEARMCNKVIKKYKKHIDLPVFWDFEYDSVDYAKKRNVTITKDMATSMADVFCSTIAKLGYRTGIYCNLDYINRYFKQEMLSKYHVWIAQWNNSCVYKDKYILWQYTDRLNIGGKLFDGNKFYFNRYIDK